MRYFNPVGARMRIGKDEWDPQQLMPPSHRWPSASSIGCVSLAMIARLRMAQGFATTFMWWIWLGPCPRAGPTRCRSWHACLWPARGGRQRARNARGLRAPASGDPFEVVGRRPGDIAMLGGSCTRQILKWRATRSLDDMTRDGWRWQLIIPMDTRTQPMTFDPTEHPHRRLNPLTGGRSLPSSQASLARQSNLKRLKRDRLRRDVVVSRQRTGRRKKNPNYGHARVRE